MRPLSIIRVFRNLLHSRPQWSGFSMSINNTKKDPIICHDLSDLFIHCTSQSLLRSKKDFQFAKYTHCLSLLTLHIRTLAQKLQGLFGLEELWRIFGVYCSSGKEALRAFGTRENKISFRRKGCELCAFWRKKSIHLKSMEIWRLACPLCLSSRGCSRLPVSLSSLSIPVFQTA